MTFNLGNRTKQTWTGTGTGTLDLAAAGATVTGYQTFASALANAETTVIVIASEDESQVEICETAWTEATQLLTRGTLIWSTTGSRIDFSAGTKNVWIDVDAAKLVDLLDGGASTAHKHDHGGMDGLGDDDHTIYSKKSGQRLAVLDPTHNTTPTGLFAWAFTSGGTYETAAGDTVTGATSSKTATVWLVYKTSGTWAGGDAAGWIFTSGHSGTFTSGENLNVGANNNVMTMTGSPVANIATPDGRSSIPLNDYDATTPECGWYTGHMSRAYAGGGVNVYLHVSMTSATSDTVGWLVMFRRIGNGTLDVDLTTAWGAYKTVTAETVQDAAGEVLIHAALAFSNGAEMDSVAAGELFQIALVRDTPNDSATGDAELVLIEIVEQ